MSSNQQLIETLKKAYEERFGKPCQHLFHSPGRVNLIGEHTDYNDGFVMPMAIEYGIWFAVTPRTDSLVNLYSLEFDAQCQFDLNFFDKSDMYWGEYVKGVAWALQQEGHQLNGWDGVIVGNIPKGAGLSSSAALEVGVAKIFSELDGLNITVDKLATLSQKAENQWVGVNCGIMDQMIVAAGIKDNALLIDCRDLSLKQGPLPESASVVIMDTSTRRGLVDSAYNERREQCEAAAKFYHADILRDVSVETILSENRPDELTWQRAKHVVLENDRTVQANQKMAASEAQALGELMYQSHVSLRDDFAVSSDALNSIVEIAMVQEGCFGARMTGAGFGGCAVALVEKSAVEKFCSSVTQTYQKETGFTPNIYASGAAQGAHKIY